MTLDEGSFREMDAGMLPVNPFDLPDYETKLVSAVKNTGLNEAVVSGEGSVGGYPVVIVVMDSRYMMGSMGTVVGEKITRAIEAADAGRKPLIIFQLLGSQDTGGHYFIEVDGQIVQPCVDWRKQTSSLRS